MSGGGGSDDYYDRRSSSAASSGGGPGGSGSAVNCRQLAFTTTVASPVAAILATLAVGDVCDLVLLSDPTRIALLTRPGGAVLGAIADRWEELVNCLSAGVAFEAELLSASSPVRAHVRPVAG